MTMVIKKNSNRICYDHTEECGCGSINTFEFINIKHARFVQFVDKLSEIFFTNIIFTIMVHCSINMTRNVLVLINHI